MPRQIITTADAPSSPLYSQAVKAGPHMLVSGITVMIAMAGMLFTGDKTFMGFGVATMIVVAVAVLGSLTVLPALLAALGGKVDRLRVPFLHKLGRSGGVAVRGNPPAPRLTPQQQAEVRQARQTYEQMRQSAPADDIIPELYLYSVLQDHLLYNDMKVVVSEMQRRQPSNPDVAVMAEYVKVKSETR